MSGPRRVRITGSLYRPQVPPGARRVDRVTRYGNPYRVSDDMPATAAVLMFTADLYAGRLRVSVEDVRRDLAGLDLAFVPPTRTDGA